MYVKSRGTLLHCLQCRRASSEAVLATGAPLHLVALFSPSKDRIPSKMNLGMLDDDDAICHVTRDGFPHLSDVEWAVVERMGLTMGVLAVSEMLLDLKSRRATCSGSQVHAE